MNRILGMEVEKQNALFAFFSDTLNALIAEAKRLGEYDLGIMGTTSYINGLYLIFFFKRMKYRG